MFRNKSRLLGVTGCLALALAMSTGAEACERADRRPIMVSVGDDGTPEVDTDTLTVCEGDTVRWVFQGAARQFSIQFTGDPGSPFDWNEQTGATVTGVVRAGAVKDGQETRYKYDVLVDGKKLDPRIIVVP